MNEVITSLLETFGVILFAAGVGAAVGLLFWPAGLAVAGVVIMVACGVSARMGGTK